MSQQKIVFVACVVVAGLVALAAGQSIDMNACSQNMQNEFRAYVTKMQKLVTDFSGKMAQSGSSAFDVEGFEKDASKLIEKYMSLADTTDGMDMQRIMRVASEIMTDQMSLMRKYMLNTDLNMGMVNNAIEMSTSMMRLNGEFAMRLPTVCMPPGKL